MALFDDDEQEDCMLSLETDPLTAPVSIRVPEFTKRKIDQLSKVQKKKLNEAILITIARALHEADFDPNKQLKEK